MNAKLFPLNPLPWEQCSNCLFYLQHMTIVFFKSNLIAFTVFVRACGGNRYGDVLEKIRFKRYLHCTTFWKGKAWKIVVRAVTGGE